MTIREIIADLLKSGVMPSMMLCRVVSVDEVSRTCELEPVNGESNMTECRMQASIESSEGICIIPSVDSFVMAAMFQKHSAVVVMFDKIDKIKCKIGDNEIKMDSKNAEASFTGNIDFSAKNIFMGGSTGVVIAPGLPPGSSIVDVSQLQVSTKLKTS